MPVYLMHRLNRWTSPPWRPDPARGPLFRAFTRCVNLPGLPVGFVPTGYLYLVRRNDAGCPSSPMPGFCCAWPIAPCWKRVLMPMPYWRRSVSTARCFSSGICAHLMTPRSGSGKRRKRFRVIPMSDFISGPICPPSRGRYWSTCFSAALPSGKGCDVH